MLNKRSFSANFGLYNYYVYICHLQKILLPRSNFSYVYLSLNSIMGFRAKVNLNINIICIISRSCDEKVAHLLLVFWQFLRVALLIGYWNLSSHHHNFLWRFMKRLAFDFRGCSQREGYNDWYVNAWESLPRVTFHRSFLLLFFFHFYM